MPQVRFKIETAMSVAVPSTDEDDTPDGLVTELRTVGMADEDEIVRLGEEIAFESRGRLVSWEIVKPEKAAK